jgi:class 3 adenylate cyclase
MGLPMPLRGVASMPFRLFGIRPSRMNPNTCTLCELMFTRVMGARQVTIDATVLFADLRGYTNLSLSQSSDAVSKVVDAFYDDCADAIWEYDGAINKTMGDAVMAIFNFPIGRRDHPTRAVLAAKAIQQRWTAHGRSLNETSDIPVGVGIGIDCGELNFGEFGRSRHDLTAIGIVVNRASRAQAAAAAGQILLTDAVYQRAQLNLPPSHAKDYDLKGFTKPTRLYSA